VIGPAGHGYAACTTPSSPLMSILSVAGGEFGIGSAQQYGEADIKGRDFSGQNLQVRWFVEAPWGGGGGALWPARQPSSLPVNDPLPPLGEVAARPPAPVTGDRSLPAAATPSAALQLHRRRLPGLQLQGIQAPGGLLHQDSRGPRQLRGRRPVGRADGQVCRQHLAPPGPPALGAPPPTPEHGAPHGPSRR
jgi:hypothetical protein